MAAAFSVELTEPVVFLDREAREPLANFWHFQEH
jgi:hypothetical protein